MKLKIEINTNVGELAKDDDCTYDYELGKILRDLKEKFSHYGIRESVSGRILDSKGTVVGKYSRMP